MKFQDNFISTNECSITGRIRPFFPPHKGRAKYVFMHFQLQMSVPSLKIKLIVVSKNRYSLQIQIHPWNVVVRYCSGKTIPLSTHPSCCKDSVVQTDEASSSQPLYKWTGLPVESRTWTNKKAEKKGWASAKCELMHCLRWTVNVLSVC